MKLEVLLSTMHQKDISIYHKMRIKTDAVIINQCDHESYEEYEIDGCRVRFICSKERGLSRSRNMALQYAEGDICLLADDDVTYYDGYNTIILEAFQKHTDADIITFNAQRKEENGEDCFLHKYPAKAQNINLITAGRITSFEIAFRKSKLNESGVTFDVRFGTGSGIYPGGGEETIFCRDCIRNGLKIRSLPIYIEDVQMEGSTWFQGYNEQFFFDKGAGYTRGMGKYLGIIMIFQFAIRKYSKYKLAHGFMLAIWNMMEGRKSYTLLNSFGGSSDVMEHKYKDEE